MPPCPECGIDESRIAVPDAIAALRGFTRRYRSAVKAASDAHESAVATAAVASFATELRAGIAELAAALGHSAPAAAPGSDLAAVEELADAAATLAERVPWEAWDRPSPHGGAPARDILARLAHRGAHHLRAITRVLPDEG
jgi:hypothetical protein